MLSLLFISITITIIILTIITTTTTTITTVTTTTTTGMENIYRHEVNLGNYLYDQLMLLNTELSIDQKLILYGPSSSSGRRTGLVSLTSPSVHATDISFFLDQEGVAVRTGHHCCQPLHRELGIAGKCCSGSSSSSSSGDDGGRGIIIDV